ncbi:MAG: hypothetical protein JEZ02_18130 [Desulfatibacillum sp.]|nr:hypothetical protein [Desulfatibacillum sp.]
MSIGKTAFTIIFSLAFCLSAYGGQSMYFDANGNPISEAQYKQQVEADRARQAAHQEAVQKAKMEREREKARKRQEQRAAAEARAQKPEKQASSEARPGQQSGKPMSSIDQMIHTQYTGVDTDAPQTSKLNTYDCYTYKELFALAEDLYVEYENGKSVPKKILMNGVWRNSEPCGENGYKVGKRLPDLKDIKWSHNKLNPKHKTGGYRGD